MSRAYTNNFKKITFSDGYLYWNHDDQTYIQEKLFDKRYTATALQTLDHNAVSRNCLIVQREQIPVYIEALFQRRVTVEVEAAGSGRAHIIFVNPTPMRDVLMFINRMPRREEL